MTDALAGQELTRFDLISFATLKTFDPPVDGAVGATLDNVSRRGKLLVINFNNDQHHVVHLMQGGRLRPDPKMSAKPRGGMARWRFGNDTAWMLTEAGKERKAGVWAVAGNPLDHDPLEGLGPEADSLSGEQLAEICAANSRRLHGLLRDQRAMAGIGRMLANEICYDAALSPFANATKLSPDEVARLHDSIHSVMAAALDHERTLDDIGKSADRPSKVHNRAGEPCVGHDGEPCPDMVRTVEYRNYTVYYCPRRQTGGKILADNTTSKFLK